MYTWAGSNLLTTSYQQQALRQGGETTVSHSDKAAMTIKSRLCAESVLQMVQYPSRCGARSIPRRPRQANSEIASASHGIIRPICVCQNHARLLLKRPEQTLQVDQRGATTWAGVMEVQHPCPESLKICQL